MAVDVGSVGFEKARSDNKTLKDAVKSIERGISEERKEEAREKKNKDEEDFNAP